MKTYIYLLILIPLISACSKNKDFVIDLTLLSKYSGKPLNGSASLFYGDGSEHYVDLGSIKNGKLRAVPILPRSHDYAQLRIFISNEFYSIPNSGQPIIVKTVMRGSEPIHITAAPVFRTKFSIKNIDCFDNTDSLWVNLIHNYTNPPPPQIYTGCIDQPAGNVAGWYDKNEIKYRTISKKNGVYDTIIHTFPLFPETYNEITLEY